MANETKHLKYFALFVGYPASGHSMVGSVLDAHPNIAISHEVVVLRKLRLSQYNTSEDIFDQILQTSSRQADLHLRQAKPKYFESVGRYNYNIQYKWQGSTDRLEVIGDKSGAASASILKRRPRLIEQLKELVSLPLKILIVLRNPFDNIVACHLRDFGGKPQPLQNTINRYLRLSTSIQNVIDRHTKNVYIIPHELIINEPEQQIHKLLEFLEQTPPQDYLEACKAKLLKKPHIRRFEIEIPPTIIRQIQQIIEKFPFLSQRYSTDISDIGL